MGMKSLFRRVAKRPAKSFDQVDRMYTRPVPMPEIPGNNPVVQFHAEKTSDGTWKLYFSDIALGKRDPKIMGALNKALNAAMVKHVGKPGFAEMNFDDTFLILRELEESYLNHGHIPPGEEPFDHYMAAHRLLPDTFREAIDEIYHQRRAKGPNILEGVQKAVEPKRIVKRQLKK